MAPKAKKPPTPPPEEPEEPEEAAEPQVKKHWSVSTNSHFTEELPAETLQAFKATGSFWEDYSALCKACGLEPHPAFAQPLPQAQRSEPPGGQAVEPAPGQEAEVAEPPAALAARSILFDLASWRIAKHLLPTALHLDTLRFMNCSLTIDQLGLLRAGLEHPDCTVQTLHVDWNPLQLESAPQPEQPEAADPSSADPEAPATGAQALVAGDRRLLRELCDQLEAHCGELGGAVLALAESIAAGDAPEPRDCVMDAKAWSAAFEKLADIPLEEVERAFAILDWDKEGRISASRLEEAMAAVGSQDEDGQDEIAAAFAQFANATCTLECLSFRSCRILRLEAVAIGRALRTSPHLKALNLWGNRICSRGAAALAEALEANLGLQYLGLGRNLISDDGLKALLQSVGYRRVDTRKDADDVLKAIKDAQKVAAKGKPVPPKKDGRGRERYTPEARVDTCEELQDASGESYWLWSRNLTCKVLSLEDNPITDGALVLQMRQFGPPGGRLVLRGAPCAKQLAGAEAMAVALSKDSDPALGADAAPEAPSGWTLVVK